MKLKILAVDDSTVVTEMIRDAFEVEGYRVLTAGDGVDALKTALSEHPDLIIADISMPGMDGWELCSQIRSNPYTSFIPFIFLTQKSEAPDRIRGLQMGADDYLTKPFAMEELLARVNLIFQRILKTQEAMITRGPQSLAGTTSHLSLPDLIQLFSLNQKTGLLRISSGGEAPGQIAFQFGRIIAAELGAMRGQKALFHMLAWEKARFQVVPLTTVNTDSDIPESVTNILMESARQRDELDMLQQQRPLVGKVLRPAAVQISLSGLSKLERNVLLAVGDGVTIQALLNQVPSPDLDVYQSVVSLLDRGILAAEEEMA